MSVSPAVECAVGEGPQLQLACHCLELLGASLGMWQSSNASGGLDESNSQDHLTGSLAQLLLQRGWLMQSGCPWLILD